MSKELKLMDMKTFKEWINATPDDYKIMVFVDNIHNNEKMPDLAVLHTVRPDPIHPILCIYCTITSHPKNGKV